MIPHRGTDGGMVNGTLIPDRALPARHVRHSASQRNTTYRCIDALPPLLARHRRGVIAWPPLSTPGPATTTRAGPPGEQQPTRLARASRAGLTELWHAGPSA